MTCLDSAHGQLPPNSLVAHDRAEGTLSDVISIVKNSG
jgi:hypothetical protein